jgi:hypothetical protein
MPENDWHVHLGVRTPMWCMRGLVGVTLALATALSAPIAICQDRPATIQADVRTDLIAARATTLEVAGGAAWSANDQLRLGGDIGVGGVTTHGRRWRLGARLDAAVQLHLDDDSKPRWGPYLVGGISYQVDARARGATYVLVALGVHAPVAGPIVPAVEVGLGGGFRMGVVLRRRIRPAARR